MHPILFHLGPVLIPTQGVLVAIGLLAGLALSSSLAANFHLKADLIWNLGFAGFLVFFVGERLLVILFNLHDFVAHPFWMLGLINVRDERYGLGGALLSFAASAAFMAAWRMPWRRTLDALAPGACLALALSALGSFAAGSDFGRPTSPHWGTVYTSRAAALTTGVPLGVPLLPLALYAAALYLAAGVAALRMARQGGQPGAAVAPALFIGGLGTVLLGMLRYPLLDEIVLLNLLTPAQCLGAAAVIAAGLVWLTSPAKKESRA